MVDILRRVDREEGDVAVTKARAWWLRWAMRVARAREIIFIAELIYERRRKKGETTNEYLS